MKNVMIDIAVRSDEQNAVVILKIDGNPIYESEIMPRASAPNVAADISARVRETIERIKTESMVEFERQMGKLFP